MKTISIYKLPILVSMALIGFSQAGCEKDMGAGNGLMTELMPAFTVTEAQGKSNTYIVKNTTAGAIATRWDFDKGAGFAMGKMIDTVFFPDAGEYNVRMQAMGKGGVFYDAAAQLVSVATSDPVAGNLVQGGKFNEGDESKWTFMTISNGVTFKPENGKMVATGGNGGHAAIYQPIVVQAGKKYKFSMTVSGSGATDTWFEVFFGTAMPVAGSDYSSDGVKFSLNTWAGCGKTAFNGDLAAIGCAGSQAGKNGEITFSESGTVYLFIKTGGSNLGTSGISIDNVELRGS